MVKVWLRLITIVALLCVPLPVTAAEKPQALSSQSAVLYEPESGRFLYEKDPDTRRPMASTTKLMTALLAAEQLPPDRVVTVPETAVLVEGSSMGLRGGDRLTVRDLLTGLLLSSGNDAANTLAMLCAGSLPAFAEEMNRKAADLGMNGSLFVTPSGLDEGGHGATARDLALLGAAVLRVELLAELCAMKSAVIHIGEPSKAVTLTNHNRLLQLYPDAIGLKTGYTIKAGKCLVSAAQRDGVTLVAVTLNGGDYWNDHIALYEYGFSQTESRQLSLPELGSIPVTGGAVSAVAATAPDPGQAVLFKGESVTCRVERPPFLWAPVQAGDVVGTIRYTVDERLVAEVPLVAKNTVSARPAWSFFEKWGRSFLRLLQEWLR